MNLAAFLWQPSAPASLALIARSAPPHFPPLAASSSSSVPHGSRLNFAVPVLASDHAIPLSLPPDHGRRSLPSPCSSQGAHRPLRPPFTASSGQLSCRLPRPLPSIILPAPSRCSSQISQTGLLPFKPVCLLCAPLCSILRQPLLLQPSAALRHEPYNLPLATVCARIVRAHRPFRAASRIAAHAESPFIRPAQPSAACLHPSIPSPDPAPPQLVKPAVALLLLALVGRTTSLPTLTRLFVLSTTIPLRTQISQTDSPPFKPVRLLRAPLAAHPAIAVSALRFLCSSRQTSAALPSTAFL